MWLRRWLRSERGSQMVEFALIGPILLYLVLSIPVFGMFVRTWIVISAAARDGARAGALLQVGDREFAAEKAARDSVYLPFEGPGTSGSKQTFLDPAKDIVATVDQAAGTITVSITYHQPSYLPMMAALLGGSRAHGNRVPLTARATFLIEKGRT